MTRTHDELREALGAHALDQLDDVDLRHDLEQHLIGCKQCRADLDEIAPFAQALRRVDPGDIRAVGPVPPVELDERIARALPPARRPRRASWAVGGALLGAAASAAVLVPVLHEAEPTAPVIIAVPQVRTPEGVTATAGLVDHTWGLEVRLEITGLPAGERFEMWIAADDGTTHAAGEFVGVQDKKIVCDMSSSVLLEHAVRFTVVDQDGAEVVGADVPA